jgi:hypothetical protein
VVGVLDLSRPPDGAAHGAGLPGGARGAARRRSHGSPRAVPHPVQCVGSLRGGRCRPRVRQRLVIVGSGGGTTDLSSRDHSG